MNRAIRRHHAERMKARFYRKQKLSPAWATDKRNAGLYANHGCDCSCAMCGNPRRHFGELTAQEKRHLAAPADATEPSTDDDYIEQGIAEEIEDYLWEVERSLEAADDY